MAGTVDSKADLSICSVLYDALILYHRPPGFSGETVMQLVPGNWCRIAY
jgi:hypothetical protein